MAGIEEGTSALTGLVRLIDMPLDPAQTPQQQAADWFALLQGDADLQTRDAFARWHDADPAHAQAYARVQRLWADADLAAALFATAQRKPQMRRWPRIVAAAAMLLTLLGAAHFAGLDVDLSADHVAPAGAPQRIALEDGSSLLLDAGAAVQVRYSAGRRDVTLLRGRVFAAVHPDAARPFGVQAGDITAQALGTAYAVTAERTVSVAVQHGRVAVARRNEPVATLTAGEAVALTAEETIALPALAADFAWTENRLVFADRPLAEVMAELDRYWPGLIWVRGEALSGLRVSGSYRLDDPPAVVAALAAATGAQLSGYAGWVLILSR